jgi:hypothetical protein
MKIHMEKRLTSLRPLTEDKGKLHAAWTKGEESLPVLERLLLGFINNMEKIIGNRGLLNKN